MRRLASVLSLKRRESTSHSSASSSRDGDHLPPSSKRSWKSWIGGKPSKARPPLPEWIVMAPPNDDDDEDEDEDPTDDDHLPSLSPSPSPDHRILKNPRVPPLPVPPFVQHDRGPLFPRSVNPPALLSPLPNTRVTLLRTRLLGNPYFDSHNPFPDISRPTSKIFPASPGIRRWIARPCFEDRYAIYVPSSSGDIHVHPISAASLAIAALEYSEHLDAMADPDFDHSEANNIPLPTPSDSDPVPSVPLSRNSYTPAPSPLRNQHNPTPSLRSQKSEPVLTATKSHVKRVVRFAEDDSDGEDGVPLHIIRMKKKREQKAIFLRQEQLRRATEEDQDRLRREQLASRLQEEALERQQKRQALEKERRASEKLLYAESIAATRIRREVHKAGHVVSSNTIDILPSSPSFTPLRDSERNKPPALKRLPHDPPSSLSIPRRGASDSALPTNSHAHPHYLSDSSPASSRPPSMSYSHSPVSPGSYDHHSRPPSMHSANTSSSEEIRYQSGSKRGSLTAAAVAAHTNSFAQSPVIASLPTWSGSNPNIQYIPPVPPFPDFAHEMPLLPPAAPFMKHSYNPRSSSRNGSSPPSSSNSRRGSVTSSTERVNQTPASLSHDSSVQSLSPSPHLPSSGSVKPTRQRRGSGDSRNTQVTRSGSQPTQTSSTSQPNLPRGRQQQPARSSTQYLQAPPPSTWIPLSPQTPLMQPMPMMVMVPAMPAYPIQMNMMNVNANANDMMQQSNLRSSASAGVGGGGGGSTSSKTATHRWRQTQAIIS